MFAETLKPFDALNIGATGVFVVRTKIRKNALRARFAGSLLFNTEIFIMTESEISGLLSANPFARRTIPRGAVKFISILPRRTRRNPRLPFSLPSHGRWLVRVLGRRGRFVYGIHRRSMKVIGTLGRLDDLFGARVTTRSWGTMEQIGRQLRAQ
ncbi:MAG: hypothetical protein HBSIN02_07920 [Bacteroidia bacterium]|nr:MAG: hypothetical protein HBSIN02_07920 [Bacteroidia bacterium]